MHLFKDGNEKKSHEVKLDRRYFLTLIFLTLLYYLSSMFGLYLEMGYGGVTPIWPPSGIAVAVFWAMGKRFWPMIILGEFFIALSLHQAPLAGVIGGIAQLIEAMLAVCLLRLKGAKGFTNSPKGVLWFSSLGALLPPLASSAIGSTTLRIFGYLGSDEYLSGFLTWWLGDTIGILVLAPILVGVKSWPFGGKSPFLYFLGFIISLCMLCASIIVFGDQRIYYLFFILIPFVVVAAIYFRLIGAGSTIILLTIFVYEVRPQDLEGGDFITAIRMAFVGACAFTGYLVTGFMESRERQMETVRRQNTYQNTLHELILGLISHLEIDRLLDAIVSQACTLIKTKDGFLFQKDENSSKMSVKVGKGLYAESHGYGINPGDGIAGRVWMSGSALMINDYQTWGGRLPDALWDLVTAVIAVPIKVDADVVGVLGVVYTEKDRRFTDDDLKVIMQFGDLTSVAWKNALMYAEISKQLRARESAEKALVVSEKTHREIFNSISEAMCVLDKDSGVIVQANKAAEEIFGITETQADQGFFSLIEGAGPPYREADGITLLRQCLKQGHHVFEWHAARLQEEGSWFEITLKTALIKDVVRIIAVARNIDDRKKAEAHLRQLQTAIDFAGDDILIADKDGHILYCNPAFEQTTGYSKQEVLGKTSVILKSGLQDNDFYTHLWRTLLEGSVWTGRFYNRCRNGKIILQDASIAPIRNNEEKTVGFVSVRRDITEYEQMKNQLLHAQKMEAIGTLAGGIAHDFNNILAGIIGYSELMLTCDLEEDHPAAGKVREVLRAGNRAAELVMQILTFSRQSEIEQSPIDIKPIAKEVVKLIAASIPPTIQISSDMSIDNSFVLASPTYIHQILMNLITNAMQAIPDEKGNIGVCLSKKEIEDTQPAFDNLKAGEYLEVSVSDTGCGMDRNTIDRVFEPYFSTKPPGKGTGLGMSVVHGIVNQLGGAITIESEVGKGTSVRVLLPVVETTKAEENTDEHSLPRGDESILFLDDNPLVTDIAGQMLGKLGYRVTVLNDSRAAIEQFSRDPDAFHLIVTDMLMPEMTGVDFCRAVKAVRPEIPVIICTGNPNNISSEDMEEIHVYDIAKKPLDFNEFAVMIRNALSK